MDLDVLERCASGEISPEVALLRLLIAHRELESLRSVLADLARRIEGDQAKRDALARIAGLLDAHRAGGALALRMLEQESVPASAPGEELARCRELFDRWVRESAEASVALYSFGSPELLDAATREVVGLLERLGVLGPGRQVLEIGCGIGRFAQALAGRVGAFTGIDIAPGMIEAARRRCAGLPGVTLLETSGRDLSPFSACSFDLVLAIDAMPYAHRAGADLVADHFAEVARVLRPGGDFVVLNLTYRGDLELDRHDLCALAAASGLGVRRNGTRDLALWDGATFHLRKPEAGTRGDHPARSSMRP